MKPLYNAPPRFNNTYAKHLADCASVITPTEFSCAKWLTWSADVAKLLDFDMSGQRANDWLAWFSGQRQMPGAKPLAQKYTGHQFGHYNPQLGDGRGLLLGEIEATTGRWDIHIKGAGQTPYSRFGDGRAVVRSCIREYLASEALHYLGIPTSRALGIFSTGEAVQRESIEQGAALVRVAPSHIRFGHFEFAVNQADDGLLTRLVHYVYDQVLRTNNSADHNKLNAQDKAYFILQQAVVSTAVMVAQWQAVGFCHGVMNTDNMSILGLTFDYGPYGFLDQYKPKHICNHSDHSGRYAFDEQPGVALWNLNVLAHALSPLIAREDLETLLKKYEPRLLAEYSELMRKKLGFATKQQNDRVLLAELLALMQTSQSDYTNTWRLLSELQLGPQDQDFIDHFIERDKAQQWLAKYRKRMLLDSNDEAQRQSLMQSVNAKYILRNHLAQEAIEAAEQGDVSKVETLFEVLQQPYKAQPQFNDYAKGPPDWAKSLSISCSS